MTSSRAGSVRRYRVYGEVKDTFRNDFEEALQRYAFHELRSAAHGEEVEGWVPEPPRHRLRCATAGS